MKKFIHLFFILFISLPNCFGQGVIVQSWGVTQGTYDPSKGYDNSAQDETAIKDIKAKLGKLWEEWKLTWDDIDGTIYVNDAFAQGVLFEDDKEINEPYFRYDAYNDEIEIKETLESKEVGILPRHPTFSCTFNNEAYYYLGYKDSDGEFKKGYLTPLNPGGEYTLFIKRIKVFKEGKEARNSFEKSFAHRFLDKEEYYVNRAGEVPVFLKTKKSEVISVFPEQNQNTIKKYIKEKRLSLGNRDDLLNLFTYANTL